MQAIVTVKVAKKRWHDPAHKIEGWCPTSGWVRCSDTTGSHHSLLMVGDSQRDIKERVETLGYHVTRIEVFDEGTIWPPKTVAEAKLRTLREVAKVKVP